MPSHSAAYIKNFAEAGQGRARTDEVYLRRRALLRDVSVKQLEPARGVGIGLHYKRVWRLPVAAAGVAPALQIF